MITPDEIARLREFLRNNSNDAGIILTHVNPIFSLLDEIERQRAQLRAATLHFRDVLSISEKSAAAKLRVLRLSHAPEGSDQMTDDKENNPPFASQPFDPQHPAIIARGGLPASERRRLRASLIDAYIRNYLDAMRLTIDQVQVTEQSVPDGYTIKFVWRIEPKPTTYMPPVQTENESPIPESVCIWTLTDAEEGVWEGECGATWVLEVDTPEGNGMKYCPRCGRALKQTIPTRPDYEDDDD